MTVRLPLANAPKLFDTSPRTPTRDACPISGPPTAWTWPG